MDWLACLRTLSSPTTDPAYPEAMRTRAWAMKTLNTQLASWTQLRHDTILYAKQSYTLGSLCLYPKAFVEPRLEFWRRLRAMAERTADRIAGLRFDGSYTYRERTSSHFEDTSEDGTVKNLIRTVAQAEIQDRQVAHLRNFSATVARLGALADKELRCEGFTADDAAFLDGLMEPGHGTGFYGGPYVYQGWYPRLFYRAIYWPELDFHALYGAGARVALVADVHTDVPAPDLKDPGSVLHQALGLVNVLVMAVDNGPDHFLCAGPVFSHYEFEVVGPPRRLTDTDWAGTTMTASWLQEWEGGILNGVFPDDVPADRLEGLAPPAWTETFLVPYRPVDDGE